MRAAVIVAVVLLAVPFLLAVYVTPQPDRNRGRWNTRPPH